MKREAVYRICYGTVFFVSGDRIPAFGKLHSDLVFAPCHDFYVEKGKVLPGFDRFVMSYGFL